MRRTSFIVPAVVSAVISTICSWNVAAWAGDPTEPSTAPARAGAKKPRRQPKAPKKKAETPEPTLASASPRSEVLPVKAAASSREDTKPVEAAPPSDRPAVSAAAKSDEAPRPFSVAPLFGYATNHANLGLGLRGGYLVKERIYVGGAFVYHLGESTETPGFGGAGNLETSVSVLYPGVEGGYELPVGPVKICPYLGLGVLFVSVSSKAGGQAESKTDSSFAFWPGGAVTYDFPESRFFLGGDMRLVIATAGGDPTFGAFATGGARF